MENHGRKVLIVDDDSDIAELVCAVLTDEGFRVSVSSRADRDSIRAAVGRFEPDCVLLDGSGAGDYGGSWGAAAWLHRRGRPIPAIMFTGHLAAADEARADRSDRSREAAFAAVLTKPFDLDELADTVARIAGTASPFDESGEAEAARTAALVTRLEAAGARNIHASSRREWVIFQSLDGALVQLYWWQRDGVYYVGRYAESGDQLVPVGRSPDLDEAVALAMGEAGTG